MEYTVCVSVLVVSSVAVVVLLYQRTVVVLGLCAMARKENNVQWLCRICQFISSGCNYSIELCFV